MPRSLPITMTALALLLGCGASSGDEDWRATLAPRADALAQAKPARPGAAARFDPQDPAASGLQLSFYDEFDDLSLSDDGAAHRTRWTDHLWYQSAPCRADRQRA